MTKKFEEIKAEEIKINDDGSLAISDELQEQISGGINPEAQEDEGMDDTHNTNCGNCNCEMY